MKHIVMFSFGLGSYGAAKRVVARHGVENTILLHTDTRYEDEDTVAWGHAAARVIGAELVVIADGRDIWEVFRDERYLGNSMADPCSRVLKRELADSWVADRFRFRPDLCVRHFGIHWSESDRFTRIQRRFAELGWTATAPLCEPPLVAYSELEAEAIRDGLWKQKLYRDGFPHANCGGRCVKQGQAGWKRLLETRPDRFAECEQKEEEMRQMLGKDVSILRDRRGGKSVPLTLANFRKRLEAGGQCDLFDWGGCGCFAGEE